jgi:stage V sporulation protein AE
MEMFFAYLKTFLIGGALCAVGQILVDRTRLTPARILTSYVVAGVILGGLGLYQPFAEWSGAGATVPLTGFGNTLASGVREAVKETGLIGAFTGGFTAAAAGICAAVFFGYIAALLCKPKEKK